MEAGALTPSGTRNSSLPSWQRLSFSRSRRTEQRVQRLRIAAALAVASTILFFSYMATLNSWTCSYAVHWQVVMSSDYTEDAKKHAATLPGQGKSCAEGLRSMVAQLNLFGTLPRHVLGTLQFNFSIWDCGFAVP